MPRNRILAQESLKPCQSDFGTFKLRQITLPLARGLRKSQLKLACIKGGQQLACAHHLAFFELHLFKHARHLWTHLDGSQWRDCAQRVQRDSNARPLGCRHAHRARAPATATKTTPRPAGAAGHARRSSCATAAAASRCCKHGAGTRQVPSQSTNTSYQKQRYHSANDGCTAANWFSGWCGLYRGSGLGFRLKWWLT